MSRLSGFVLHAFARAPSDAPAPGLDQLTARELEALRNRRELSRWAAERRLELSERMRLSWLRRRALQARPALHGSR